MSDQKQEQQNSKNPPPPHQKEGEGEGDEGELGDTTTTAGKKSVRQQAMSRSAVNDAQRAFNTAFQGRIDRILSAQSERFHNIEDHHIARIGRSNLRYNIGDDIDEFNGTKADVIEARARKITVSALGPFDLAGKNRQLNQDIEAEVREHILLHSKVDVERVFSFIGVRQLRQLRMEFCLCAIENERFEAAGGTFEPLTTEQILEQAREKGLIPSDDKIPIGGKEEDMKPEEKEHEEVVLRSLLLEAMDGGLTTQQFVDLLIRALQFSGSAPPTQTEEFQDLQQGLRNLFSVVDADGGGTAEWDEIVGYLNHIAEQKKAAESGQTQVVHQVDSVQIKRGPCRRVWTGAERSYAALWAAQVNTTYDSTVLLFHPTNLTVESKLSLPTQLSSCLWLHQKRGLKEEFLGLIVADITCHLFFIPCEEAGPQATPKFPPKFEIGNAASENPMAIRKSLIGRTVSELLFNTELGQLVLATTDGYLIAHNFWELYELNTLSKPKFSQKIVNEPISAAICIHHKCICGTLAGDIIVCSLLVSETGVTSTFAIGHPSKRVGGVRLLHFLPSVNLIIAAGDSDAPTAWLLSRIQQHDPIAVIQDQRPNEKPHETGIISLFSDPIFFPNRFYTVDRHGLCKEWEIGLLQCVGTSMLLVPTAKSPFGTAEITAVSDVFDLKKFGRMKHLDVPFAIDGETIHLPPGTPNLVMSAFVFQAQDHTLTYQRMFFVPIEEMRVKERARSSSSRIVCCQYHEETDKLVATLGCDMAFWYASDGRVMKIFDRLTHCDISAAYLDETGQRVAYGTSDGRCYLYNLVGGKPPTEFKKVCDSEITLAWTDGDMCVFAAKQGKICSYCMTSSTRDVTEAMCELHFEDMQLNVGCIGISEKQCIIGDQFGRVTLFDMVTGAGKILTVMSHRKSLTGTLGAAAAAANSAALQGTNTDIFAAMGERVEKHYHAQRMWPSTRLAWEERRRLERDVLYQYAKTEKAKQHGKLHERLVTLFSLGVSGQQQQQQKNSGKKGNSNNNNNNNNNNETGEEEQEESAIKRMLRLKNRLPYVHDERKIKFSDVSQADSIAAIKESSDRLVYSIARPAFGEVIAITPILNFPAFAVATACGEIYCSTYSIVEPANVELLRWSASAPRSVVKSAQKSNVVCMTCMHHPHLQTSSYHSNSYNIVLVTGDDAGCIAMWDLQETLEFFFNPKTKIINKKKKKHHHHHHHYHHDRQSHRGGGGGALDESSNSISENKKQQSRRGSIANMSSTKHPMSRRKSTLSRAQSFSAGGGGGGGGAAQAMNVLRRKESKVALIAQEESMVDFPLSSGEDDEDEDDNSEQEDENHFFGLDGEEVGIDINELKEGASPISIAATAKWYLEQSEVWLKAPRPQLLSCVQVIKSGAAISAMNIVEKSGVAIIATGEGKIHAVNLFDVSTRMEAGHILGTYIPHKRFAKTPPLGFKPLPNTHAAALAAAQYSQRQQERKRERGELDGDGGEAGGSGGQLADVLSSLNNNNISGNHSAEVIQDVLAASQNAAEASSLRAISRWKKIQEYVLGKRIAWYHLTDDVLKRAAFDDEVSALNRAAVAEHQGGASGGSPSGGGSSSSPLLSSAATAAAAGGGGGGGGAVNSPNKRRRSSANSNSSPLSSTMKRSGGGGGGSPNGGLGATANFLHLLQEHPDDDIQDDDAWDHQVKSLLAEDDEENNNNINNSNVSPKLESTINPNQQQQGGEGGNDFAQDASTFYASASSFGGNVFTVQASSSGFSDDDNNNENEEEDEMKKKQQQEVSKENKKSHANHFESLIPIIQDVVVIEEEEEDEGGKSNNRNNNAIGSDSDEQDEEERRRKEQSKISIKAIRWDHTSPCSTPKAISKKSVQHLQQQNEQEALVASSNSTTSARGGGGGGGGGKGKKGKRGTSPTRSSQNNNNNNNDDDKKKQQQQQVFDPSKNILEVMRPRQVDFEKFAQKFKMTLTAAIDECALHGISAITNNNSNSSSKNKKNSSSSSSFVAFGDGDDDSSPFSSPGSLNQTRTFGNASSSLLLSGGNQSGNDDIFSSSVEGGEGGQGKESSRSTIIEDEKPFFFLEHMPRPPKLFPPQVNAALTMPCACDVDVPPPPHGAVPEWIRQSIERFSPFTVVGRLVREDPAEETSQMGGGAGGNNSNNNLKQQLENWNKRREEKLKKIRREQGEELDDDNENNNNNNGDDTDRSSSSSAAGSSSSRSPRLSRSGRRIFAVVKSPRKKKDKKKKKQKKKKFEGEENVGEGNEEKKERDGDAADDHDDEEEEEEEQGNETPNNEMTFTERLAFEAEKQRRRKNWGAMQQDDDNILELPSKLRYDTRDVKRVKEHHLTKYPQIDANAIRRRLSPKREENPNSLAAKIGEGAARPDFDQREPGDHPWWSPTAHYHSTRSEKSNQNVGVVDKRGVDKKNNNNNSHQHPKHLKLSTALSTSHFKEALSNAASNWPLEENPLLSLDGPGGATLMSVLSKIKKQQQRQEQEEREEEVKKKKEEEGKEQQQRGGGEEEGDNFDAADSDVLEPLQTPHPEPQEPFIDFRRRFSMTDVRRYKQQHNSKQNKMQYLHSAEKEEGFEEKGTPPQEQVFGRWNHQHHHNSDNTKKKKDNDKKNKKEATPSSSSSSTPTPMCFSTTKTNTHSSSSSAEHHHHHHHQPKRYSYSRSGERPNELYARFLLEKTGMTPTSSTITTTKSSAGTTSSTTPSQHLVFSSEATPSIPRSSTPSAGVGGRNNSNNINNYESTSSTILNDSQPTQNQQHHSHPRSQTPTLLQFLDTSSSSSSSSPVNALLNTSTGSSSAAAAAAGVTTPSRQQQQQQQQQHSRQSLPQSHHSSSSLVRSSPVPKFQSEATVKFNSSTPSPLIRVNEKDVDQRRFILDLPEKFHEHSFPLDESNNNNTHLNLHAHNQVDTRKNNSNNKNDKKKKGIQPQHLPSSLARSLIERQRQVEHQQQQQEEDEQEEADRQQQQQQQQQQQHDNNNNQSVISASVAAAAASTPPPNQQLPQQQQQQQKKQTPLTFHQRRMRVNATFGSVTGIKKKELLPVASSTSSSHGIDQTLQESGFAGFTLVGIKK